MLLKEIERRTKRAHAAEAGAAELLHQQERLTPAEIAQEFGVSERTWRDWAKEPELRQAEQHGTWRREVVAERVRRRRRRG